MYTHYLILYYTILCISMYTIYIYTLYNLLSDIYYHLYIPPLRIPPASHPQYILPFRD